MTLSISETSSVVVDASVLIDAFRGFRRVAAALTHRQLHAPGTVDAEVLHGLRRAWLGKRIDDEEAQSVLAVLADTPIVRYPIEPFVRRIWSLRQNITAYDAAYVALAESLDLPLITRDARLARSSGHAARIEYIT
jgi:predicted nucleic acid-binding protein